MRIHLIKEQTIWKYINSHASGRRAFENWLKTTKYADWDTPEDIQLTFGSVDLLGNRSNRAVFNIGGNNYRVICKYHFGDEMIHLFLCWIGTHTQYDEICKSGQQFTINLY
jgi:mRNA interferase HigB